jgi:uncharacterized Zn finger protein (UPF0148 family)
MADFNKEAERERLREKYGEEEADREATEQMSELLLKGATMTNAHCNNCGDPIFRYDGQEFCPTCQQPVDRGDADGDAGAEDDNENIEVATPSDDARVQFGGADQQAEEPNRADDVPDTASTEENATPDPKASPPQQRREASPTGDQARPDETRAAPSLDPAGAGDRADDSGTTPRASGPAAGTGDATGHLTNAQTMLAQTVEQYARLARDADSPRQAQEYLEAAREAAQTLAETGY